jgi:hypothetical protein
MPARTDDPPPQPPEQPLPGDCCGGGCAVCVFEHYALALEEHERRLAAWRARQAEDGATSTDRGAE